MRREAALVVELQCKYCEGNWSWTGPENRFRPCEGVHGMAIHVRLRHEEERVTHDWVARNCVRKILSGDDIEDVRKGVYQVDKTTMRSD